MRKELKYNWLLTFPGNWKTKEGYILSTIDRPAKWGFGWYRFRNHEFEVKCSYQAQLKAEELIESDLVTFKRALNNADKHWRANHERTKTINQRLFTRQQQHSSH